MSSLLQRQFIRFLLVGSINTALSYGLYVAFLWLGLNFALANGLAFVISLLFSFGTQGALVFRNAQPRLFVRFVLVWLGIYLINIALISGLIGLGLNAYSAGAVALVPVTLLSYFLQKFAVFGAPSRPDAADAAQPTP